MIRVNLLPKEERVTTRSIKLPKVAGMAPFAILPLVLLLIVVSATLEKTKVNTLNNDVTEIQEEVRRLQPQVDRVKRLTAKREELERRLDVIKQLDHDRFLSVRIMDDLSRHMPRYLWIDNVTQLGPGQVTISGVTFSNLIVADFMMRLERSALFSRVDLSQTEKGDIEEREVIRFSLTSDLTPEDSPDDLTADVIREED